MQCVSLFAVLADSRTVIATQPVDNSHLYDILKIDPKSQTFDNTERTIALSLGPAFLGVCSPSRIGLDPASF